MLHHFRGSLLLLQILSSHKYTKVNSSQASLQYFSLQRKAISILSLFYCLSLSLHLPQQPTGWKYPNSLFHNTYFADSWLLRLAHFTAANVTRRHLHCVHSVGNGGGGLLRHRRGTKNFMATVQKESGGENRGSKAFFMCLLREEQRMSYKS